jgi:hypothetical protein
MERLGRIARSHKVLTILTFVIATGIAMQLLSGAMDQYWRKVEESYVVATRKAEEYQALGGKARVARQEGGLYYVMYEPVFSQPVDLCDGSFIVNLTFDPPIPPDP